MHYIEYCKQLFHRYMQIPDFAGMTGFGAFCPFSDSLEGRNPVSLLLSLLLNQKSQIKNHRSQIAFRAAGSLHPAAVKHHQLFMLLNDHRNLTYTDGRSRAGIVVDSQSDFIGSRFEIRMCGFRPGRAVPVAKIPRISERIIIRVV